MLSRENAVLLVSTTLTLAGLFALAGSTVADDAAIGFALFAGAGVLAPQAYLAWSDDTVATLSRVRAGAVVTLLLGMSVSSAAAPGRGTAILVAGLVPLGGLVGYEVLAGYRESRPGVDPE